MRRSIGRAAAFVGAALLAGGVAAQEPGSRATRDYVQAAAQSDTFEMMEAYSALAESRDPQVRAFAQKMIEQHGQTSETLRQATARAGLKPPPMAMGGDQSALLAALQSARGAAFDQAYWRHQALAHRAALITTQTYAAGGDDAPIRQAAAAAVPIISAHLAMAEQMFAASGGS